MDDFRDLMYDLIIESLIDKLEKYEITMEDAELFSEAAYDELFYEKENIKDEEENSEEIKKKRKRILKIALIATTITAAAAAVGYKLNSDEKKAVEELRNFKKELNDIIRKGSRQSDIAYTNSAGYSSPLQEAISLKTAEKIDNLYNRATSLEKSSTVTKMVNKFKIKTKLRKDDDDISDAGYSLYSHYVKNHHKISNEQYKDWVKCQEKKYGKNKNGHNALYFRKKLNDDYFDKNFIFDHDKGRYTYHKADSKINEYLDKVRRKSDERRNKYNTFSLNAGGAVYVNRTKLLNGKQVKQWDERYNKNK